MPKSKRTSKRRQRIRRPPVVTVVGELSRGGGRGGGKPRRPIGGPKGKLNIEAGPWPTSLGKVIDPNLRLAVNLVGTGNSIQLYQKTGVQIIDPDHPQVSKQFLPLILEFKSPIQRLSESTFDRLRDNLNLDVAPLYREEAKRNSKLTFATARLLLSDETINGNAPDMQGAIIKVLSDKAIKNATLAPMFQPSLQASCVAMDVPADRVFRNTTLKGTGVIVGIVDDGCALAHWDFMAERVPGTLPETRILYLWDQSLAQKNQAVGWNPVGSLSLLGKSGYGYDIAKPRIDMAIQANVGGIAYDVIDADAVHDYLGYQVKDTASHGTHCLDIAAGNGQSLLMGAPGLAPEADIIFVQLAQDVIETGGQTLANHILDGIAYIFNRASSLNQKCVVNVSFGAYAGPHDGSYPAETLIDQLLTQPDRAVIIAAGNGFEAQCHARGTLTPKNRRMRRRWILKPEDPTVNSLELWYNGNAKIDVTITAPDPTVAPVTAHLGDHLPILNGKNLQIGQIDSDPTGSNGDRRVSIFLFQTLAPNGGPVAPTGTWYIDLQLVGNKDAHFHAWIERDDEGTARNARRLQSHFHEDDAHPIQTITNLATGQHTIAVGAYNTETMAVCRYSACGPTRKSSSGIKARKKPEVLAPAEELALGGGVLSASSGRALPTRAAGTSAAAPHVAGLVALIFQFAGTRKLYPKDIRRFLKGGATKAGLVGSRHQKVDVHQRVKQAAVWNSLIGQGRVDAVKTIKQV